METKPNPTPAAQELIPLSDYPTGGILLSSTAFQGFSRTDGLTFG
jgi:hypothetical protein